jgi:hypothetical protein
MEAKIVIQTIRPNERLIVLIDRVKARLVENHRPGHGCSIQALFNGSTKERLLDKWKGDNAAHEPALQLVFSWIQSPLGLVWFADDGGASNHIPLW